MPVELRFESVPPKEQMTAALGTGQAWGGGAVLPSSSPGCRCKEDPGWNLDLFAKRVRKRGER